VRVTPGSPSKALHLVRGRVGVGVGVRVEVRVGVLVEGVALCPEPAAWEAAAAPVLLGVARHVGEVVAHVAMGDVPRRQPVRHEHLVVRFEHLVRVRVRVRIRVRVRVRV